MMNLRLTAAVAALFATGIAAAPSASANNYVYTQIQIGANPFACATGINNANHVVGEYYGSGSAPFGGYVYVPGGSVTTFGAPGTTDLLDPCAYVSGIMDISNHNLVVAILANSVTHKFVPFTFNPGTGAKKKLPTLARITVPTAINTTGEVVGTSDKNFPFEGHGIVISAGVATLFDPPGSARTVPTDIADDGTVVGFYVGGGATHGFVRSPTGAFTDVDVPGSTDTEINSINTVGDVAGKYYDSTAGHYLGFTKSGSNILTYQFPGAGDTEIVRTLPSGLRIGNYTDASDVVHGFSFLPNVYSTLDPAPGVAIRIRAVNDKGNFVGNVNQPLNGSAYLAICPPHLGVCLH
jgi:hypothetical protein